MRAWIVGIHSVTWDEAQKISGKDPDFHRRNLWESIEHGDYPEWEFGVQIIEEKDEHKFDFDLLDATKLIPEELVPVQRIGKMTLNRNPDNFFAETGRFLSTQGTSCPGSTGSGSVLSKLVGATLCGCPFGGQARRPAPTSMRR